MASALSPLVTSPDLGTTNRAMFEDLRLPAGLSGIKSSEMQLGARQRRALKGSHKNFKSILSLTGRQ